MTIPLLKEPFVKTMVGFGRFDKSYAIYGHDTAYWIGWYFLFPSSGGWFWFILDEKKTVHLFNRNKHKKKIYITKKI